MRSCLLQNLLRTTKLFHESFKLCPNNAIINSRLIQVKKFSKYNKTEDSNDENAQESKYNLAGSINITHKAFDDKDAEIILDTSERQQTINIEDLQIEEVHHDPYEGLNLERGETGVFEIEDLVQLLRKDNAINIFVVSLPSDRAYVDYIVVVTGKSQKHMKALAAFVRKVYKLKKHTADPSVKIEGEASKDWIALDLGNIALHIFSKSARSVYDLETLWSIGPDFDDNSRITTDIDIMKQYNEFLSDFQPMEDSDKTNNEIIKSHNN
ncbi:ribosomal silencing factor RsfS-like protein, 312 isoform X1 [Calliopsis andreniformis]|uniref:ribosomal silencing factor RsfS-like protein, 312 isoform X1 n=1 Tax=Calliopsis andreniformis TaxID=337506 RepID=UPI003FCD85AA